MGLSRMVLMLLVILTVASSVYYWQSKQEVEVQEVKDSVEVLSYFDVYNSLSEGLGFDSSLEESMSEEGWWVEAKKNAYGIDHAYFSLVEDPLYNVVDSSLAPVLTVQLAEWHRRAGLHHIEQHSGVVMDSSDSVFAYWILVQKHSYLMECYMEGIEAALSLLKELTEGSSTIY